MNLNNWYSGKVIDKTTSKSLLIDTERMIKDLGFEIEYEVYNSGSYEDSVTISAYILFDENKQIGELQLKNKGMVVISTKSLVDKNIIPTEGDKLTYDGDEYNVVPGSIYYYSRDNKEVDTYKNSFFVQLTINTKRGHKRTRGFG